jgi:endonuclease-3
MEPKADWFPHGEKDAQAVLRRIVPRIRKSVSAVENPSVNVIACRTRSPFKVLVSTVISARTKEDVTMEASKRLFARVKSVRTLASMREQEIADCIYPAGFYRSKAKTLRALARMIIDDFGGKVPDRMEELLALPGVGRKTANLVITAGFGKPGICVDTHVHRISNRVGAVRTANPTETEFALRRVLPRRYWIEINGLLVKFGRAICTPLSPFCSTCTISNICAQTGVKRIR